MFFSFLAKSIFLQIMTVKSTADFLNLFKYIAYISVWSLIWVFENIYLLYHKSKYNSNCFAVRKRIIVRMKGWYLGNITSPLDYIGIEYNMVPIDYLLRDNVFIFGAWGKNVLFVETPQELDIYNTDKVPFIGEPQTLLSTHALVAPMSAVHALGERLGDPKRRVIYQSFVARSGSTLLSQIFYRTGKVHTLSLYTPHRFLYTTHKHLPEEEKGRIILTVLRLMCKPTEQDLNQGTIVTLVRPLSHDVVLVPLLKKYVPWLKHIAIRRAGLKSVHSIQSFMFYTPNESLFGILFLRKIYLRLLRYFENKKGDTPEYVDCNFMLACWQYASQIYWINEYCKMYDIPCYTLEDLINNTEATITEIFNYCSIPDSLVKEGKLALKSHSQARSGYAQQKRLPVTEYTGEVKAKADRLCREIGVPSLEIDT